MALNDVGKELSSEATVVSGYHLHEWARCALLGESSCEGRIPGDEHGSIGHAHAARVREAVGDFAQRSLERSCAEGERMSPT